jgi:hypothetical protein
LQLKAIICKKVHKTSSQPIAGCSGMLLSSQLWREVEVEVPKKVQAKSIKSSNTLYQKKLEQKD